MRLPIAGYGLAMNVAQVREILATRNADEDVLVHTTTRDGAVAVCEVTGHTTIDRDDGIVLLAECVLEPPDVADRPRITRHSCRSAPDRSKTPASGETTQTITMSTALGVGPRLQRDVGK